MLYKMNDIFKPLYFILALDNQLLPKYFELESTNLNLLLVHIHIIKLQQVSLYDLTNNCTENLMLLLTQRRKYPARYKMFSCYFEFSCKRQSQLQI